MSEGLTHAELTRTIAKTRNGQIEAPSIYAALHVPSVDSPKKSERVPRS